MFRAYDTYKMLLQAVYCLNLVNSWRKSNFSVSCVRINNALYKSEFKFFLICIESSHFGQNFPNNDFVLYSGFEIPQIVYLSILYIKILSKFLVDSLNRSSFQEESYFFSTREFECVNLRTLINAKDEKLCFVKIFFGIVEK